MAYKFTSNGITVEFDDNSQEVLDALRNAVNRGLKAVGEVAVSYAQDLVPVKTTRLKTSISCAVDGDDVYIGTNVEYAPYVEFGTGEWAENGGRKTPWVYQDGNGRWHMTTGQHPKPFLRPSASQHSDEYRQILKDSLENA